MKVKFYFSTGLTVATGVLENSSRSEMRIPFSGLSPTSWGTWSKKFNCLVPVFLPVNRGTWVIFPLRYLYHESLWPKKTLGCTLTTASISWKRFYYFILKMSHENFRRWLAQSLYVQVLELKLGRVTSRISLWHLLNWRPIAGKTVKRVAGCTAGIYSTVT